MLDVQVKAETARGFEAELRRLRVQAIPYAVRDALNTTAFEARGEWVRVMRARFTLRNRFTENSARVTKAKGLSLATMASTLGSTAPYMAVQERGGTKARRGKHGVAIPTASASGQGAKAKRTRPIRRGNYLGALQVAKRVPGHRFKKNAAAIAMAKRNGGVAYVETPKVKGLFRIKGSAKRPKLQMLYDLSHGSVRTPASKTLGASVDWVRSRAPAIAVSAFQKQIMRHRK